VHFGIAAQAGTIRGVPAARAASTVVLARAATQGFEVFLVRRHENTAVMGGAHVFPGGRVEPSDFQENASAWCDGVDEAVARIPERRAIEAIAFYLAAVRELFEEAGVLLARDHRGNIVPIDQKDEARFLVYRRELMQGRVTLRGIAEREQLRMALDGLAMFAHWVTPEAETRRFDTHFFLAIAPGVQQAAHDEHETTHGVWMTPSGAIESSSRGEIALPPPTWTNLRALSRIADLDQARHWARHRSVPRVQPCAIDCGDGTRMIVLPGDPLCPPVEGFEAEQTRFLLKDGRWRPIANA
jgi:8-oxo-dGTP pyrophosphatase MutT (NUDIX family)